MTRFKEGDAVYYRNHPDGEECVAVLITFDKDKGFTHFAYRTPRGWFASDDEDLDEGWWPGHPDQTVRHHDNPDVIWADYCAWRLTQ